MIIWNLIDAYANKIPSNFMGNNHTCQHHLLPVPLAGLSFVPSVRLQFSAQEVLTMVNYYTSKLYLNSHFTKYEICTCYITLATLQHECNTLHP